MRLSAALVLLALAACSTTETLVGNEPLDRCSVTSCFNRLQVRNFELIDDTSLLLFVGSQDCPFLVEFTGTFCDLTFLPGNDIPWAFQSAARPNLGRPMDMRICSNNLDIGIADRLFSAGGGAPDSGDLPCTIRRVKSLTDDEVLEVYVDNGITAPPPPFGTGEIEVNEDVTAEKGEAGEQGSFEPEPAAEPTTLAVE